jgi:hypothetical protein
MYVSVYLPEREVEDFENDVAQADENQNQYLRSAVEFYRKHRDRDDDQPAAPVIEA